MIFSRNPIGSEQNGQKMSGPGANLWSQPKQSGVEGPAFRVRLNRCLQPEKFPAVYTLNFMKRTSSGKKTGLREIAALAEVSITTVSRVLNGNNRVDPAIQQKVLDAA